jgi:hydroxymethylpyrimidine pyrophosphatase-like HAD family hydrolase
MKMKYKGQIALDIDGTVTASRDMIANDVIQYIHRLSDEGWFIHFVTGRTFPWAMHILDALTFPFALSAFNGAETYLLPEKKLIRHTYISKKVLSDIVGEFKDLDIASMIYCNHRGVYSSYFYPAHATTTLRRHIEDRIKALKEQSQILDDITGFPYEELCSMRCFGLPTEVALVGRRIEEKMQLLAPQMTDSYDPRFSIVQVTSGNVSKGEAIKNVFDHIDGEGIIIGCGDDYNDVAMLEVADIKVVMASAPHEVLRLADVVAPPAKELGIIYGLSKALEFAKTRKL